MAGYVTMTTVKTRKEWEKQAEKYFKIMGQKGYKTLDEYAEKDPKNCGKLLQSFDAMGLKIDPKLAKKCKIKYYKRLEEVI